MNKIEWFEFDNTIADDLNKLSETHEILDVQYVAVSSSDWEIMAGGYTYALVKARRVEERQ